MRTLILRDTNVYTVKTLTTTTDELGGQVEDWQGAATINAEIQPLSGDATRKEMGVTERSTHKAFGASGAFTTNTRLVDSKGNAYLVGYIADWGSHEEAILEKVVV